MKQLLKQQLKMTQLFDSIFNSMFSSSSPYLDVKKSIGTSNPTPGSYAYSSKIL